MTAVLVQYLVLLGSWMRPPACSCRFRFSTRSYQFQLAAHSKTVTAPFGENDCSNYSVSRSTFSNPCSLQCVSVVHRDTCESQSHAAPAPPCQPLLWAHIAVSSSHFQVYHAAKSSSYKLKHPEIFTKPEIMPCSLRQSSMRTGPRIPENPISKTPSDPKIAAPGVICFREAWLSTFSGDAIGLCNLKQWPAEASTSESRANPGDQTQGDIAKAAGGDIDRRCRNTLRSHRRYGS